MKKRILSLLMAALLVAGMFSGCGAITPEKARSGVVRVMAFYDGFAYDAATNVLIGQLTGQAWSLGTAFGVGDAGQETDVFVTNRHVVEEEMWEEGLTLDDGRVVNIRYGLASVHLLMDDYGYTDSNGLDPSRSIPCSVIYCGGTGDPDLAVLQAAEVVEGRIALPLLAEGVTVDANTDVRALGYPGSTDEATVIWNGLFGQEGTTREYAGSVDKVTVTNGIVSLHTTLQDTSYDAAVRVIQHTATINHGNSGGPLITTDGVVIGVNTWGFGGDILSGDQQAFAAIEINYVRDILDDLDIDYDVSGGDSSVTVIAIVAVVGVLALVLFLLLGKKKKVTVGDSGGGVVVVGGVVGHDSGVRIQAQSGHFTGRRFAVNGQVRIGRDPARNDLVYPADTKGISGVHCVIRVENGGIVLQDLGSTYGTFLGGGQRLAAQQTVVLKMGDRFYLGSEQECFIITGKGGV